MCQRALLLLHKQRNDDDNHNNNYYPFCGAGGCLEEQVYGAMWAPVLVAQQSALGLGTPGRGNDSALVHAREVFRREWASAKE